MVRSVVKKLVVIMKLKIVEENLGGAPFLNLQSKEN